MPKIRPLQIDIVSDVVCPWCYIGKHRFEQALTMVQDIPVEVHWRPFFLNPWVPREGMSREDYLIAKFGSVSAYQGIAVRVAQAAAEEGLVYNTEQVKSQPNTLDCHRLIHWADMQQTTSDDVRRAGGNAAAMKQRLMELYFRDGGDLTDLDVLAQAASAVGLDVRTTRERLGTDEDVDLISAQAKEASEKGVSGVPTFVMGQKFVLSGARAPDQLARAIRQVAEEASEEKAE